VSPGVIPVEDDGEQVILEPRPTTDEQELIPTDSRRLRAAR